MKFTKAHGLGNDFILVAAADGPAEGISSWARRLCDRHTGVGGDGVLLYGAAADGVTMRLLNADGSDGEISGNGLRCLAAFAVARGLAPAAHVVHTAPGPRPVEVESQGARRFRIATDLGAPILESDLIPVALLPPRPQVLEHPLQAAGREVRITATSLGNPHCAVFLDARASDELFTALGPALESHPFFPKRTNVEFVVVRGRGEIEVRFWERGVGPDARLRDRARRAPSWLRSSRAEWTARSAWSATVGPSTWSGPKGATSTRSVRSSCSSKASGSGRDRPQLRAFGTASEKGAIVASKVWPPAATI